MNTSKSKDGKSLYRITVLSLIAALMLASFSATSIFVRSASAQVEEPNELEVAWAAKLNQLAIEVAYFNNSFGVEAEVFNREKEQQKHDQFTERYRAALVAAQSLVVTQSGFDINGQMTNERQAKLAIQQLGNFLSLIRGLRAKITPVDLDNE